MARMGRRRFFRFSAPAHEAAGAATPDKNQHKGEWRSDTKVMSGSLLPPSLLTFLHQQPTVTAHYRTPRELDAVLLRWQRSGATLAELGYSKGGAPIRAAVIGTGPRTLLAWGFPHPDEPIGAEALCWLGDGALAGALPDLAAWRLVLVLCADPDEASRQRWFIPPTGQARDAAFFCAGTWRPTKLDWMVDYGFPLDWGPFWQPPNYEGACRTLKECKLRCGDDGCVFAGRPPAPLPESLALAEAIDRFRPDVVAAMHNTHSGGDYTFLLEREQRATLEALVALPGVFGLSRQLGAPVTAGGAGWRTPRI